MRPELRKVLEARERVHRVRLLTSRLESLLLAVESHGTRAAEDSTRKMLVILNDFPSKLEEAEEAFGRMCQAIDALAPSSARTRFPTPPPKSAPQPKSPTPTQNRARTLPYLGLVAEK